MSAARFRTFGCRLNSYESEAMADMAREAGLTDAVVINTCAVTGEAVRQARQQIRRARREDPAARIVVTGCAAQTDPETFKAMPEVDLVIGNAEKMRPAAWTRIAGGETGHAVGDIMVETRAAAPLVRGLGGRARAYVQVQTGCDHRCTFCIIPYGRGNSRSVPVARVCEQVRKLRGEGFNEIVLTGVDLTSWGADLDGAPKLGALVAAILRARPDLPRLRLSSIDSIEVDEELMALIGGEPRLMPHLHLSLQHGDDMILKRMKRRHSAAQSVAFCEQIRALRPDIVFGADIIAGFPTETDAMFENAERIVESCGLTWLHVFPFSPRTGTPAARMPQVDGGTIRARAARLRARGAARVEAHLAAMRRRPVRLLMEKPDLGRTEGFALTRLDGEAKVGDIVEATVTGHEAGRLLAAPRV